MQKPSSEEIRKYINEIVSGERIYRLENGECVVLRIPRPFIRLKADMYYDEIYNKAVRSGISTRAQMEKAIAEYCVLDLEKLQTRRRDIEERKRVVDTKLKFVRHPQQQEQLRKNLEEIEKELYYLKIEESKPYQSTAENKAEQSRTMFLVVNGVFNIDGTQRWKSIEDLSKDIEGRSEHHNIVLAYVDYAAGFGTKLIRLIARNPEWQIYWRTMRSSGSPLFAGCVTEWDVNKLLLVHWSQFYEDIKKNQECPAESVIEDDIELDKWVEDRQRLYNKDRNTTVRTTNDGKTVTTHQINQPYKIVTKEEARLLKEAKNG